MSYKNLPLEQVQHVSPLSVQQYARSSGWEKLNSPNSISIYKKTLHGVNREFVVPHDPDLGDYSLRIAEAIYLFGEDEKRSTLQVLNDLLGPAADVLRFRLAGAGADSGTVQFLEGLNLLNGAKKALLASAYDVIHPSSFHPRLGGSAAEDFLNECRLGQTERGSYITTILCPIGLAPVEQNHLFGEQAAPKAFARRVTEKFMSSVNHIVQSITEDKAGSLLSPSPNDLISANFYDGLSEMRTHDDGSFLEISSAWSRALPAIPTLPPRVRIRADLFTVIEQIANEIRPRVRPARDTFIGKVDSLRGKPDDEERMQGETTLSFIAEDELVRARIDLDHQSYGLACDAHKEGKYVSVNAVLTRGARVHRLSDFSDFKIVV